MPGSTIKPLLAETSHCSSERRSLPSDKEDVEAKGEQTQRAMACATAEEENDKDKFEEYNAASPTLH